jgi:hypothetical protein
MTNYRHDVSFQDNTVVKTFEVAEYGESKLFKLIFRFTKICTPVTGQHINCMFEPPN